MLLQPLCVCLQLRDERPSACFPVPPRHHYWKYFGPPQHFSRRTAFKRRHSGVANSTTCVYLHFAACYHYVQRLHCAKTVVVVVAEHLHGLVDVLVSCLSSPLPVSPPPPGSEASLGNSLNTSEEELHTAGITLAPKGSGTSHQPISIQIAPARALIAITFALIAIAATRTSSTFD